MNKYVLLNGKIRFDMCKENQLPRNGKSYSGIKSSFSIAIPGQNIGLILSFYPLKYCIGFLQLP